MQVSNTESTTINTVYIVRTSLVFRAVAVKNSAASNNSSQHAKQSTRKKHIVTQCTSSLELPHIDCVRRETHILPTSKQKEEESRRNKARYGRQDAS